MRKFVFVFFSNWVPVQIMLLFHGRRRIDQPQYHLLYLLKILVRIGFIPKYSWFCPLTAGRSFDSACSFTRMAFSTSPFCAVGKKNKLRTVCKWILALSVLVYIRIFCTILLNSQEKYNFLRSFLMILSKAQNLPTSKFENFSLRKLTQQYIQMRYFVVVFNYAVVWYRS